MTNLDDIHFKVQHESDGEQLPLFDTGKHAKETKSLAYASSMPRRKTRRDLFEELIAAAGDTGLTRDEIGEQLNLLPNQVTGPVNSLLRSGRIVETSERRKTRLGSMAAVVVINPNRKG